MVEEMNKCPISRIEEWANTNEKQCRSRYEQLQKEAEEQRRKAEKYKAMKAKASMLQECFARNTDFLGLLTCLGGEASAIQAMQEKLNRLTLEDVIKDGDIDGWLKRNKRNSGQPVTVKEKVVAMIFENADQILDVSKYMNALHAMYMGTRDSDMYTRCLHWLVKNRIVSNNFTVDMLKTDYRYYAGEMSCN